MNATAPPRYITHARTAVHPLSSLQTAFGRESLTTTTTTTTILCQFDEMLRWREANDIGSALTRRLPKWSSFKQAYPFYIHGRSKDGCIVAYEQPGSMDLALAVKNGMTTEGEGRTGPLRHAYHPPPTTRQLHHCPNGSDHGLCSLPTPIPNPFPHHHHPSSLVTHTLSSPSVPPYFVQTSV